jgi:hypothetical protein
MNDECRFERDVLNASRHDRWTDALREHARSCETCSAAAAVSSWMDDFSSRDDRAHSLPDPSVVWLKAQLLGRHAAVERASRPMNAVQMAAYLIVAAGWAAIMTWKWHALQAWLLTLSPSHFLAGASGASAGASSLSLTFFAMVVVLSSLTVMLAFHTIMAEE